MKANPKATAKKIKLPRTTPAGEVGSKYENLSGIKDW